MPRIPLSDALSPFGRSFDRLPARRCYDLYLGAEPLGQVVGDEKCCERRVRAVQPDHDPVRMPALTPPWAGEENRARRIVKKGARGLAGHHAEESAAAPTSERNESGVVLVADVSQNGFRITSHDLRRAVWSVAHDLDRGGAGTLGLLFELSHEVVHLETGVHRTGGIEGGDGEDGRAIWT